MRVRAPARKPARAQSGRARTGGLFSLKLFSRSYSPIAIRLALPPAAAVLIVTVCSVAKRVR